MLILKTILTAKHTGGYSTNINTVQQINKLTSHFDWPKFTCVRIKDYSDQSYNHNQVSLISGLDPMTVFMTDENVDL